MKYILYLLLLLAVFAQAEEELLPVDKAFVVSASVVDDNILLNWDIAKNYYLYKDKIKILAEPVFQLGSFELPEAKMINDDIFGRVGVYRDNVTVKIPLLKNDVDTIILELAYQGCADIGVCYPPQKKVIAIDVNNSNSSFDKPYTKTQNINNTNGTAINATASQDLNLADKVVFLLQQNNLLLILLSFFWFGVALTFTPCVLPIIPILSTIIIGSKKTISTKKALVMSIVFVLAMSVTYAIAGMLAGYFGSNLQILFQNPIAIIIFSLILVALALSMFGYFEIQLPVSWQHKIIAISNRQKSASLSGVAIMGVLSALIIGPCVAPALAGALIYIGQTGDAFIGGLSLFVMGLGMGVFLIIVGTGISKLPKLGIWQNKIKHLFGILILAVAILILERIISPTSSLVLWALLLTISPIAMGVFNSLTSISDPLRLIFRAIGLIILGYSVLIWIAVASGGNSVLQPLAHLLVNAESREQQKIQFRQVKSSDELEQILLSASNNQVVMLDFYADWCISCKQIESLVFANTKVVQAASNIIALKADVTKYTRSDKEFMRQFDVVGPPAILFFKNANEVRSKRIIGEVSVQDFLNRISTI